ncbi:glycoside hydrolase family 16 protein [Algoriphagus persicinus]|uniref:glycoside hydrolase family 16 protein n=1 Tax=Algoriphagus persicinus TaxID=3108754 RepID=UPI002B37AF0C|nr:glycoside hydrolase family 16 protein [Algoriphagus sp. E1-3-M2]MEB2785465.1 glycoside hydrolase family 16 protein [Algoriphagus sp. E1-3-M2]
MKTLKSTLILVVTICFLASCSSSSEVAPTPVTPNNIILTVEQLGNGEVKATFSATNASFFKISFGMPGEIPKRVDGNSANYIYKEKGDYNIILQAHATELIYVVDTKVVNMNAVALGLDPNAGHTSPESYAGYKLTWADEFNSSSISENWTFELGDGCPELCGWGNEELEYYKKENTSLADGKLIITAKQESEGGKDYTSSRMITKGKQSFTYGRIDIRAILPKGQGLWPALWMLGANIDEVSWPKCGEIDIMELIGGSTEDRDRTIHGTVHWDNAGSYANYGGSTKLASGILNDEFHVFSIDWDTEKIVWLLDGVEFHVIDIRPAGLDEFHKPMFFIFNVAVGGKWPGRPDGSTVFPQEMKVDYVRVFQKE